MLREILKIAWILLPKRQFQLKSMLELITLHMGAFRAQTGRHLLNSCESFLRALRRFVGTDKNLQGVSAIRWLPRWVFFSMFLVVVTHHQSIATQKHMGLHPKRQHPSDFHTLPFH